LIDYCWDSSKQYFRHIQDENKFNKIYKLDRNERRDVGQQRQRLLTAIDKVWRAG